MQNGRHDIERFPSSAQERDVRRNHVHQALRHTELGALSRRHEANGHAPHIVEQELVLADMCHDGRKVGKIGIERRCSKIARIGLAWIGDTCLLQRRSGEQRAAPACVVRLLPLRARSAHGDIATTAAERGTEPSCACGRHPGSGNRRQSIPAVADARDLEQPGVRQSVISGPAGLCCGWKRPFESEAVARGRQRRSIVWRSTRRICDRLEPRRPFMRRHEVQDSASRGRIGRPTSSASNTADLGRFACDAVSLSRLAHQVI